MSSTIDERIVDMQFNNKQFEEGIQTSLKSLSNLKNGLNNVENTSALNGLQAGVQTIADRFSTLGIVGVTALVNITNSAIETGKRMVSALTIDPIKMGFQEYETQINAVQTILANTASKGTSLNQVNAALDELNTYADKTIYNFTEMTRNIGTFTAAGVDLDVSVQAIKGIANLAAVSGSNAQQASTAMYQLSQALASGTVKLMDWNSVVNAGMGGQVFQDALKETARVHGVAIDDMIKSEGSFRETLKDGWLTSDILTETLNKFTGDMSEAQLKQLGYTQEQITEIMKLGEMANAAATEVKTFTQLFDTLKEAAQSGWTQSWETIIGDFGEAKQLLTEMSNIIGSIISDSADRRNAMLTGGLSSGWKQFLSQGIADEEGYKAAISEVAKVHNMSLEDMIEKEGSFEAVLKSGWLTSDMMAESLEVLTNKTKGLSDEQLREQGYTRSQIDELEALNASVKDGSISLNEFAEKMAKASGRENLIQALRNSFEGLVSVVKPINEAFREIFPPTTGEQLYAFTEGILKLTEKFKMSEETSKNLNRTFAGLFAVIDIGKELVTAIAVNFAKLVGDIIPCTGGLLAFTGVIGDFIVGLDEAVQTSDVFNKIFESIYIVVSSVVKAVTNDLKGMLGTPFFQSLKNILVDTADAVVDAFTIIANVFGDFGNIDLSGVGSFTDALENHFHPFTTLGNILSSAMSGITNVLETFAPIFITLGTVFGKAFSGISDAVTNTFTGGGFDAVLDLINGGLFAAILIGIKNFIGSLTDITDGAGGLLDGVVDILDGVRGSLEAYQTSLKAKTLLTIAGAIAVLSGSLVILSLIDSEKLMTALGAITVLFVELSASMIILQNSMGGTKMVKVAGTMVAMSVAILILSSALKSLAELDWDGITKGSVGIGVLMTELQLFLKNVEGSKLLGASTSMIAIGIALNILADAVKKLGSLNIAELSKGLSGVGVILSELLVFINLIKPNKLMSTSIAMIAIGGALKILASAVNDFGSLDLVTIAKGLSSMGVVLAEIGIFANLVKPEKLVSTGIAMIAIGGAMLIFAEAIGKMGMLNPDEIGKGLITMGGALTIITIAMNLLPKDVGIKSAGILILSSALVVLSEAMSNMGGMSWTEIAKSLITLAGSLTIITIAMQAMTGGLAGAAAMVVMSTAIMMLVPSLMLLGNMSITEIGLALLSLAGVFTVIGVAGLVLAPLTPIILGLSAAIALLGVGILAIGGGLLAFSAGLTALSIAGTVGAASLVLIITSVLSLIPMFLQKVGEGIVAFAGVITSGMPAIIEAIKALVEGIIVIFGELTPKLLDTLFTFMDETLSKLLEYTPKFVDTGMKILAGFLKGVSDNIQDVVELAIDLMVNFLEAVATKIPDVVDVAVDIIVAFAEAIGRETPRLVEAGFQMIIDFINGLAETVREKTPELVEAIVNLAAAVIEGLVSGLVGGVVDVVKAIGEVGQALIDGFKDLLGIHSPSRVFDDFGSNIVSGLLNGLSDGISSITNKAKEIGTAVINGVKEKFETIGEVAKNMTDGLVKGLQNGTSAVTEAAKGVAKSALDGAKDFLDIHSPSRKFEKEIGENVALGMAKGINNKTPEVGDASSKMSDEAYNNAKLWIKNYQEDTEYIMSEELSMWEILGKKYSTVSKEKIEIDENIAKLREKLQTQSFENSTELQIYEQKEHKKLTIGKINDLDNLVKKHSESVDEQKKKEVELLDAKKTYTKEDFEESKKYIEYKKKINQLSLQEEIIAWERVQARYAEGTEQRKEADIAVYEARQALMKSDFEKSKQWIEDRKQMQELSILEEIAAWERVQARYAEGTEQRKEADKSLFEARQELFKQQEDLMQQMQDAEDKYFQAIDDRQKELVNSFSLFEELKEKEKVSGETLKQNLQDQVDEMRSWSENMAELSRRGIDEGLLAELQQMGPEANAEIAALLSLTDEQLTDYVDLWKEKNALARIQAIDELQGMREETEVEIAGINEELAKLGVIGNIPDLVELGQKSIDAIIIGYKDKEDEIVDTIAGISKGVNDELVTYGPVYNKTGGSLMDSLAYGFLTKKTNVINTSKEISNSAVTEISSNESNFEYAGINAIYGFIRGMQSKISEVAEMAATIANVAYESVKSELDIHSPSRAFMKIGEYSGEGMIVGLRNMTGLVGNMAGEMGNTAITSLGNALSNISDVLVNGIDAEPTIRPVIDLTDINSGLFQLDQMLNGRTLNVDLARVNAVNNSTKTQASPTKETIQNVSPQQPSIINQFDCTGMVVRNEQDIDLIASKLFQKQQVAMRGRGQRI